MLAPNSIARIQKSQLQPSARPKKAHGLDKVDGDEVECVFTFHFLFGLDFGTLGHFGPNYIDTIS
jgi:hypothetical protein